MWTGALSYPEVPPCMVKKSYAQEITEAQFQPASSASPGVRASGTRRGS